MQLRSKKSTNKVNVSNKIDLVCSSKNEKVSNHSNERLIKDIDAYKLIYKTNDYTFDTALNIIELCFYKERELLSYLIGRHTHIKDDLVLEFKDVCIRLREKIERFVSNNICCCDKSDLIDKLVAQERAILAFCLENATENTHRRTMILDYYDAVVRDRKCLEVEQLLDAEEKYY